MIDTAVEVEVGAVEVEVPVLVVEVGVLVLVVLQSGRSVTNRHEILNEGYSRRPS